LVTIKFLEDRPDLGGKLGTVREERNETLAEAWVEAGICSFVGKKKAKKELAKQKAKDEEEEKKPVDPVKRQRGMRDVIVRK
jgi:hypothetical protein